MSGGDELQRMRVDNQSSRLNPPFPKEEMTNENYGQPSESMRTRYQKHEDDLKEIGLKIKHHEENISYLKNLRNKVDRLILDLQVDIGKYHVGSFSIGGNQDPVSVESKEGIHQHILKHKNSAAAILCEIKFKPGAQVFDHLLTKDVLGFVATLAKVDDANLSRILSEYLGLETMLAVVCETYEGVKFLEGYTADGSINKGLGIHALAEISGRSLENRFLVICLEHLRPYIGAVIVDDPQRRLDILKPRIASGETPPGFIGFAVNMLTIDSTDLFSTSKNGHTLRETLFYNLFSDLQVYRSREEMLKALPYIKHGAISLDGGVIKSPGVFSLGRLRSDIDVKFASGSKGRNLPESYFEVENKLKESKWEKDRATEDMQREQALLDRVKINYEAKKKDFIQFIAEYSTYAVQRQMGQGS